MHPPFARGVTHLSYVGDTPTANPTTEKLRYTVVGLSAYVAITGRAPLGNRKLPQVARYAAAAAGIYQLMQILK